MMIRENLGLLFFQQRHVKSWDAPYVEVGEVHHQELSQRYTWGVHIIIFITPGRV
jgi:hypothetical protein